MALDEQQISKDKGANMGLEFPPIYVMRSLKPNSLLTSEETLRIERELGDANFTTVQEAKLVITDVTTGKRAWYELKNRGLFTEEVWGKKGARDGGEVDDEAKKDGGEEGHSRDEEGHASRAKKVEMGNTKLRKEVTIDSSTESEVEEEAAPREKRKQSPKSSKGAPREKWTKVNKNKKRGKDIVTIDSSSDAVEDPIPPRKKMKTKPDQSQKGKEVIIIDSSTESDDGLSKSLRQRRRSGSKSSSTTATSSPAVPENPNSVSSLATKEYLSGGNKIKVVELKWYYNSVEAGFLLPTREYLIYEGRITDKPNLQATTPQPTILPPRKDHDILARARADTPPRSQHFRGHRTRGSGRSSSPYMSQTPRLLKESTSDYGDEDELPPLPAYCRSRYSCERKTPLTGPNDRFIDQLKVIKLQRKLVENDKGVSHLAYSKAIAAIAAYPYTITSPQEILRLQNCGQKYFSLYKEWRDTNRIREVEEIEADQHVQVLKLFYEIYDVAEVGARAFYNKGYRDLDDIVNYEWDKLPLNIQVGIKFYDDFQTRIPREEVEQIGDVILQHAKTIDEGFQAVIVGGYRRGKPNSGDVDVIITHPDEDVTQNCIDELVTRLGESKWVFHRLRVSNANSNRGQEAVSHKGDMPRTRKGFCTLDKAFLVWQSADLLENPVEGKPNFKRRVDIIVTPWKTAGCAIVGWSGGTMFERDLRSYCRKKKGMKFDSTGVRRLDDGDWVDLEGDARTLEEKERRVFEGLGLEWRDPTERCTG